MLENETDAQSRRALCARLDVKELIKDYEKVIEIDTDLSATYRGGILRCPKGLEAKGRSFDCRY